MFFEPGKVYRDYWVESVLHTPFGEWALALDEAQDKVYLQHVPLRKPAPQSLIDQYFSLDHPLLVPYWQVYQESEALVFVRPHVHVDGLIYRCPTDEETAAKWCEQLSQLEAYLQNRPIPMKIVYVPENIGVTEQGDLRVFLCGDPAYMQCDFSDRDTFRRVLLGKKGKEKASPHNDDVLQSSAEKGTSGKWLWGLGIALALLVLVGFVVGGFGLMHLLQRFEVKPVPARTAPPEQAEADPQPDERDAEAAPDPAPSEDASPPTQEDVEQSRTAAEEFISSLDQDEHQQILKKKARSMTVLPGMEARKIDSRLGEITWEIEAEVYHSDGNMEGKMYRTVFRVITVKENGAWQVKDAEVTAEERL